MVNAGLTISLCLVIALSSVCLINAYLIIDNDNGCQKLKQKLHQMTDISDENNLTGNITKKAQDSLNVLNDYISECDR
jgi:hypothetical protein